MCFLSPLEETKIVPIITAQFRENPEGCTLDQLRHAITGNRFDMRRDRIIQICTTLEWSGFCTIKRVGHELRVVPSDALYAQPVFVN